MNQAAEEGAILVERQTFLISFDVTRHCCSCVVGQVGSTIWHVEMLLASGSIVSGNCSSGLQ